METQKWLKRTKISFLVFLGCCLLLCVYLFYYEYTQDNRLWLFGLIGMCGWMFNPVPLIFSTVGFLRYRAERKNSEFRALVGKRWLYFPMTILGYAAVWYWTCFCFVRLTGGV